MSMEGIETLAGLLAFVLVLPLGLAAYRMIAGPGFADRFVALDMLTAVAVAFAAMTALATGRSAFLDVGLVIALVNFVATCAFAAFLERKGSQR
ncbi:monovalent cation/H+ antiporter complex subunit F [Roseomonas gilardii subsp. gilardii]|jgi:multicomponent Na+:H+ antiporter subunit F|uniref:monovalent cation/H+ antiporter complex subunit F n=1 Tax=Roseomonas gilardii TaxID=257708 RepID=UPI001FF7F2FD|nr:monovalent cation/H+ antiporter complex subunit F [Roseomonas gilardii]UPG73463.1 monovalent cation/H+ antiporter complex subunit F [Roseomonas gilardii subsp. gilardii]